ncbi:hypothetical protein WA026_015303 [Henosepilachna vigintioctopunctata]|uniref:Fatty acyl-CoA reductase n=1 Tax=Henosepilachna vigintioctopunctata TaxID=420089 RepID=A0AAW1TTP4_9CUCU
MDVSVEQRYSEQTSGRSDMKLSEIQKFFVGQTIFVTGGTGFLGKLVIEKLLRDCNDLKKIYILVRTKKGKRESERFQEIFNAQCFSPLKEKYPNFLEKVALINGDLTKPDIGLSEESKQIITTEVTTIFHVAATVRFDEHLRLAAYINVRSVKDLLRMAKTMPQLKAIVHVSTAYSHCTRNEIKEEFYPPPITAENLLNVVDSLDDETITKITPILLKEWPNGYVFTKAVAESVIEDEGKDLPIGIVRPAIVTSSVKEPTMPAEPTYNAELVPVDFVINTAIAASWHVAKKKSEEGKSTVNIFNYVLSSWLILTWGKFFEICSTMKDAYPVSQAVWHFCFKLRPNPIMHELAIFFLHTIPAYIIDLVLICIGRKAIAVKGYKKVRKFLDVIAYFAKRNWDFGSQNTKNLLASMTPEDREIFGFEMGNEGLETYMANAMLGGRTYLLQDPPSTIPAARKKVFRLKIAHYILCTFLLYLLLKTLLFVFSFVYNL